MTVGIGIVALFGPGLRYVGSHLRGPQDVLVYSSRRSPNGSLVAESVGRGEDGGRLVVRAKDGSERSIDFPEPPFDLFLQWKDDTHLELSSYRPRTNLRDVDRLGDVSLSVRSFQFPKKPAYEELGVHKITVPARDVVATFARQTTDKGQICILKLGALRHTSFDAADVEITAAVNTTCRRPRPCMGIHTRFTLEGSREQGRQSTLTSATVADIPSYNRLPTGDQGTAIRGQFLGQNAKRLIEALAKPSVTLDFSRDFFAQIIDYELTLSGDVTTDFRHCVGDAEPV